MGETGGVTSTSGVTAAGGVGGTTGVDTTCLFYSYQGSDYTLLVSDDLISLQITPVAFDSLSVEALPSKTPWPAAIAGLFRDNFDMHLYVMNRYDSADGATAEGRNVSIHTPASGLGMNFDYPDYASWQRLLSLVFLGRSYDLSGGNVLHEIVHTWANFVIPEGAKGHWPDASDVAGALGSFVTRGGFRHVGGNAYAGKVSSPLHRPYADLELYLMGVLPPSEVSPITLLTNATTNDFSSDNTELNFTADGMVTRDIETIIATYGARVPSSTDARHDFRALPVIVTPTPLSSADWLYYRAQAAALSSTDAVVGYNAYAGTLFSPPRARYDVSLGNPINFRQATGGRATLKLSGLLDSLVDRAKAVCVRAAPPTGNACAAIATRATECGIPLAPCDIDVGISPMYSDCIVKCANDATCDVLKAATSVVKTSENRYIWCASACQCKPVDGCTLG